MFWWKATNWPQIFRRETPLTASLVSENQFTPRDISAKSAEMRLRKIDCSCITSMKKKRERSTKRRLSSPILANNYRPSKTLNFSSTKRRWPWKMTQLVQHEKSMKFHIKREQYPKCRNKQKISNGKKGLSRQNSNVHRKFWQQYKIRRCSRSINASSSKCSSSITNVKTHTIYAVRKNTLLSKS